MHTREVVVRFKTKTKTETEKTKTEKTKTENKKRKNKKRKNEKKEKNGISRLAYFGI